MADNADQQDALALAYTAAGLLNDVRALAGELEEHLANAIRAATDAGLSRAIVADAVGLTPGRISQIALRSSSAGTEWRDRLVAIDNYPGDAMHAHRKAFAGRMTYPPYPRRRTRNT
jgi:RecA/RadA recombinase